MFALVNKSNNSIIKMYKGNSGVLIGDNQYPQSIFTLWSEAERNAIDIYTVEYDNTNLKDGDWYVNTNQSYSFDGSKVTASYGTATEKPVADTLFTAQDETDGLGTEGEVKAEGLKTKLIRQVKGQVANELKKTDWYALRKADADTAIPSAVATHRAAVRTKSGEMETAITNASDLAALITLYTHTEQEDGTLARPLGEIPIKEF